LIDGTAAPNVGERLYRIETGYNNGTTAAATHTVTVNGAGSARGYEELDLLRLAGWR
jgi:hypothetical protein